MDGRGSAMQEQLPRAASGTAAERHPRGISATSCAAQSGSGVRSFPVEPRFEQRTYAQFGKLDCSRLIGVGLIPVQRFCVERGWA